MCDVGYIGSNCHDCAATGLRVHSDGACIQLGGTAASCSDGVRNGNEEGVDCGGPDCDACGPGAISASSGSAADWLAKHTRLVAGVGAAAGVITLLIAAVKCWNVRHEKQSSGRGVDKAPGAATLKPTRRISGRQPVAGASSHTKKSSTVVPENLVVDWTKHEKAPTATAVVQEQEQ